MNNLFHILGFTRPALLNQHIKKVHLKVMYGACPYCGREFAWKEVLERHIEAKHSGNKIWQCEMCAYVGTTKHNLNCHKAKIHSTQYVKCDFVGANGEVCGAEYPAKDTAFRAHKLSHTQVNKVYDPRIYTYACDFCPKRFKEKGPMGRHVQLRHSKVPVEICPVCTGSFVNSQSLHRHLQTSHPEYDKYFCKYCPEKFYNEKKLNTHILRLHSEDSVECHLCGQWLRGAGLNKHLSKTHNIHMARRKKEDRRKAKKNEMIIG